MEQAYLQLVPTSQTVCRQLKSLLNPEIRHFYIKIFGQIKAQSETLGDCVKILIFAS